VISAYFLHGETDSPSVVFTEIAGIVALAKLLVFIKIAECSDMQKVNRFIE
jgi:hypothetical protein